MAGSPSSSAHGYSVLCPCCNGGYLQNTLHVTFVNQPGSGCDCLDGVSLLLTRDVGNEGVGQRSGNAGTWRAMALAGPGSCTGSLVVTFVCDQDEQGIQDFRLTVLCGQGVLTQTVTPSPDGVGRFCSGFGPNPQGSPLVYVPFVGLTLAPGLVGSPCCPGTVNALVTL